MKKTLVTFIITILMLATFVTTVQALSFGVTLTPSTTEVEKGGTVKVVVSVNSIDAGNGLNALLGNLEYDNNIFETVSSNDINALNRWDAITYNANSGKLVTTKAEFVNNNSDVFEINLKVKSTATVGSTTVTLKNISASNSQQDISAQNTSCTITVKEKTTTPDTPTTTTKPTAEVKYETVDNGIKVTVTSNSTLKALAGWTLSANKKQLSKVYTADYTGTLTITDENGNVSDPITINAKVGSNNGNNNNNNNNGNNNGNNNNNNGGSTTTDKTKPTATVKYTKDTKGVVTVTITASEQIQAVTGWTLSADKKTLTKQYTKNTTETITIVDLAGNKSEAIKIEVDTSLSNGGKDFGTGNNNGSNGTKSPDSLPKAGVGFILPVIAIITVVGAVAFVRYKSMEY